VFAVVQARMRAATSPESDVALSQSLPQQTMEEPKKSLSPQLDRRNTRVNERRRTSLGDVGNVFVFIRLFENHSLLKIVKKQNNKTFIADNKNQAKAQCV
jgi:hypothetical protein